MKVSKIASKPEELESEHNYPNNFSDYWMYTDEGASYLDITFDENTNIEDGFDFFYIYDKDGIEIGCYTGTELAGRTVHVEGDTVKFRLISDESGTEWGFKVTKIETDIVEVVASGWSGYLTWELTKDGVLTFSGEGAMKNYKSKSEMPWYQYFDQITSVVLEEGVTTIGAYAFYGAPALESITIPESVTAIESYVFKNAEKLDNVILPSGLTKLGEKDIGSAFYGCTGLTELVIPDKVITIKPYAFKTCTGLTSVTLGSKVAAIGEGAFNTCTGLKTIVFPASVTAIGDYCFFGSNKLWQITFLGDAPAIGTGAFKGITATAYYPADNEAWTADVMQNYGGTITWKNK